MTSVFNKKSQTPRRKLLRRNLSKAEILLWLQLKNKKINGHKFRRQYSVGRYVVDFYCPELKLAVEEVMKDISGVVKSIQEFSTSSSLLQGEGWEGWRRT